MASNGSHLGHNGSPVAEHENEIKINIKNTVIYNIKRDRVPRESNGWRSPL